MKIAVVKEVRDGERRVALVPESCRKLVKAGISADVIVAKIQASETAFATDADSLVALANEKVPNSVIEAMMARAGRIGAAAFLERFVEVGARGAQRRDEAEGDAGDDGKSESEGEDLVVDAE